MSSIDEYLNNLSDSQKAEFKRIWTIVKQVAPEAEETISYGMPAFKYKGKRLLYSGAFKDHMSLFPGAPLALKHKLEGFKMSKGTIQFTAEKPLPDTIIKEILHSRLADIK